MWRSCKMEEYNNIENNMPNALNAIAAATATNKSNKNKTFYNSMDIVR